LSQQVPHFSSATRFIFQPPFTAIQLRDDGFPLQTFCRRLEAFLGLGQVEFQNRFHHCTASASGFETKTSPATKFV
jgi:hypothetical protein